MPLHLALWNIPPASFVAYGMCSSPETREVEIEQHDAGTCADLLLRGMVDVALLPSTHVLAHPEAFDILPGIALSTWSYPYAQLVLREGFGHLERVAFNPSHGVEALITRVILKEHYRVEPTFVSYERRSPLELLAGEEPAALLVGADVPTLHLEGTVLNLGQEWYELVNYPMVWGLFVGIRDRVTRTQVETMKQMVRAAEASRAFWLQANETPPALHAFYAEHLRLRFDDLVMASLTELRQYLYYYGVTNDLPDLPFVELPEEAGRDEDEETPLL